MKQIIDFENPKTMTDLVKTLVAKTPVAYIVLDRDFRIHFINDYFLDLRKLRKGEVLGQYCYAVSNEGSPCRVCAVKESILTGERKRLMRRDVLPDGTVRYIDDYAVPLLKEGGGFDYILEIMINRSQEMEAREKSAKALYKIVDTLTSILDKKDHYTKTHSRDVSVISRKLARYVGLSEEECYRIGLGALLHDIGKVGIADYIINKKVKLDNDEYGAIKSHPSQARELLRDLSGFAKIKDMCHLHHERWDGQGYPLGLAGAEIPLGARIIALADTYDAMTSDRSYRRGLPHATAIKEIEDHLGRQFDPDLGGKFMEMARTILKSREEMVAGDLSTFEDYLKESRQVEVSRVLTTAEIGKRDEGLLRSEELSGHEAELARLIFKHTPAYYTIIDESFGVLYASESISRALGVGVEELTRRKCHELNGQSLACLRGVDGALDCPTARAFSSGTEQHGKIVEKIDGQDKFFDIDAVPLSLYDRQGRVIKCVMEIMIDRTKDVLARKRFEEDIQAMIGILENLAVMIDPQATKESRAILQECESFAEYMGRFERELFN